MILSSVSTDVTAMFQNIVDTLQTNHDLESTLNVNTEESVAMFESVTFFTQKNTLFMNTRV